MTGGLHEDGLADTADGLAGGRDPARKLEIMRDSRLGTFGVLALVLSVGLRAAALVAMREAIYAGLALVAAHAASRALVAAAMWALPPARRDGQGFAAGRPRLVPATAAILIAVAIGLAALGPVRGAVALGLAAAAAGAVALLARRQTRRPDRRRARRRSTGGGDRHPARRFGPMTEITVPASSGSAAARRRG